MGWVWKKSGSGRYGNSRNLKSRVRVCRVLKKLWFEREFSGSGIPGPITSYRTTISVLTMSCSFVISKKQSTVVLDFAYAWWYFMRNYNLQTTLQRKWLWRNLSKLKITNTKCLKRIEIKIDFCNCLNVQNITRGCIFCRYYFRVIKKLTTLL